MRINELKGFPKKKEEPKDECLCFAHSESECGCGNYPSNFDRGYNSAIEEIGNIEIQLDEEALYKILTNEYKKHSPKEVIKTNG